MPHRSDGSETAAGKRGSARRRTTIQRMVAAITSQEISYTIANGTTREELPYDSFIKTKITSNVSISRRAIQGRSTSPRPSVHCNCNLT